MWKLPDEDLEALIRNFESSDWREMRLRMEGVELVLAKDVAPQWREIPLSDVRSKTQREGQTPGGLPVYPRERVTEAPEEKR